MLVLRVVNSYPIQMICSMSSSAQDSAMLFAEGASIFFACAEALQTRCAAVEADNANLRQRVACLERLEADRILLRDRMDKVESARHDLGSLASENASLQERMKVVSVGNH